MVILEAELALPAREWYIHASGQFCWSKLALLKAIKERIHETIAVYSDDNPCHSHVTGSDENGSEESSGTLLQCLRVAEIQRELQRDGRYNSHTRNLLPTFTGIAGGAHDTPMLGKSAATSHEREQNDMAEELHTRPVHRMSGTCLHGLSRKTPSPGVKSEKIGVVNNKTGAVHKQQSLRSLWRSCVYTRKLHCHPEASPYNIRTPQISKSQPVLLQAVRQSPNDSV